MSKDAHINRSVPEVVQPRQPTMPSLRTADTRFKDLQGWTFAPNYTDELVGYSGLRMHYVDEGPYNASRTAICLHGQKTWSYAFRKAIPFLLRDGYRVIVPDLFGFGRSDKIINDQAYSFDFHRKSVLSLIEHLGLQNLTLIGFDWGGWLSAVLPLDIPNKAQGLILGNMMLPESGFETWPGFHLWKSIQNAQSNPKIGKGLSDDVRLPGHVIKAYDAPFPSAEHKAAVRRFPNLVPDHEVDPLTLRTAQAVSHLKSDWRGKAVCVAGLKDPLFGLRTMRQIQSNIQGSAPLIRVDRAGPLVFEDADSFMPAALRALK